MWPPKVRLAISTLITILLFALVSSGVRAYQAPVGYIESPQGTYQDLNAALAEAEDGDRIDVYGGTYSGPFLVTTSVELVGHDWPVLDGQGKGSVISLQAAKTRLEGFVIRNSGDSLDEENSGIEGLADHLLIVGNRLEDTLFGIYLKEASNTIIRGNQIFSKALLLARRGDPIRVWYSNQVLIENNIVMDGRDVVLWYSEQLTVSGNQISRGRYGLHFMYCDDAYIHENLLMNNSVGAFLMYSRRLRLEGNTIASSRGPSGYGIGMKDLDDAVVWGNLFFSNRIGAYLDNSPREVDSIGTFSENVFAFNDTGVYMLPSVRNNLFYSNSFIDNQQHVGVGGGGLLKGNTWFDQETGNYWSDYAGYDAGQDGIGDVAYVADRLFENIVDRYAELRLFIFSPASLAIDFAAKAVPLVKPEPKLVDEFPLMDPFIPEGLPALPAPRQSALAQSGLVLLGLSLGVLLAVSIPRKTKGPYPMNPFNDDSELIRVSKLTKTYASRIVLDEISFSVKAGEALALWGANGAGKTTALRCLLGLLSFRGDVHLFGMSMRDNGKAIRGRVGFVPQELSFHDEWSGRETVEFYGRLKKVPVETALRSFGKLDFADHLNQKVGELSGGMKQRLAVGIALLSDPDLLILDEPTSNLDVHSRDNLLSLFIDLKRMGKTLVFSSHRMDEVISLADRVLVLHGNRIVADCPPDRVSQFGRYKAMMRLIVPADEINTAIKTLRDAGVDANPNGRGIWVELAPGKKAHAINLLYDRGIPVVDFDIDHIEGQGQSL